jgi:hypothetical protein
MKSRRAANTIGFFMSQTSLQSEDFVRRDEEGQKKRFMRLDQIPFSELSSFYTPAFLYSIIHH